MQCADAAGLGVKSREPHGVVVANSPETRRFELGLITCTAVAPCVALLSSGRVPDLRSIGRGFKSQPPGCQVQPWASC